MQTSSLSKEQEEIIKKYTDIKQPGSYAGLTSFAKSAKIPISKARAALSHLPSFIKNFESRTRFDRNAAYVTEPKDIYGGDLLDLGAYKGSNYRYRYVLVVVDIFSKMVYAEPLLKKSAAHSAKGMRAIIERAKIPKGAKLWLDRGSEFLGEFARVLREHGIKPYHTTTIIKSSVVERYQREIRRHLRILFAQNRNKKWYPYLQDIVRNMNNQHSALLKMAPSQAFANPDVAMFNMYKSRILKSLRKKESVLPNGTRVAISQKRLQFEKGTQLFGDEVFEIVNYQHSIPVGFYRLKDNRDNILQGRFNRHELQPVFLV